MPYLQFHFPVVPTPKARPILGKFGTYTPTKTKQAEWEIKQLLMQALPKGWKPVEGPIEITVEFCFLKPESAKSRIWHTVRPDADNLSKLLQDAFNGVFYRDDSQIVTLEVRKKYDIRQGTHVWIGWREPEAPSKRQPKGKP